MMRVILNGNGTTQLWDLVKHFIKPELLDDETIDAESQIRNHCQSYSKSTRTAARCNTCEKPCKCYPKDIIKHSKYGWILNDKKSPLLRAAEKGRGI